MAESRKFGDDKGRRFLDRPKDIHAQIYHFAGNKNYGNTKEGAYMCERDATGKASVPRRMKSIPDKHGP
jgi:hypothetical protein